ncbi:hypothetical protein M378DRAFT_164624 [Amanita muscaria Koide BX008]|uniref:Uncharacterized protein n=1 Tax=Amanita muscaria (strain Koide BX008) TaxID=946122 RepID=A0A0C2X2D6_AMAMK|nr:hypothetical protein M378DRAFT_164624 [Amanita muscaria Koide BX008]
MSAHTNTVAVRDRIKDVARSTQFLPTIADFSVRDATNKLIVSGDVSMIIVRSVVAMSSMQIYHYSVPINKK